MRAKCFWKQKNKGSFSLKQENWTQKNVQSFLAIFPIIFLAEKGRLNTIVVL